MPGFNGVAGRPCFVESLQTCASFEKVEVEEWALRCGQRHGIDGPEQGQRFFRAVVQQQGGGVIDPGQ